MRKQEHPSCGCTGCRDGRRRPHGQYICRNVNRRIRRTTKRLLSFAVRHDTVDDSFQQVIVSTPYTD